MLTPRLVEGWLPFDTSRSRLALPVWSAHDAKKHIDPDSLMSFFLLVWIGMGYGAAGKLPCPTSAVTLEGSRCGTGL